MNRNHDNKNHDNRNHANHSGNAVRRRQTLSIQLSAGFFSLLFVVMMAYMGYYSATHQEDLFNNSYNAYQRLVMTKFNRGKIYSGDGEVLASTREQQMIAGVPVEDDKVGTREYPYGDLFAHSVGYTGRGKSALELYYNYYLAKSEPGAKEEAKALQEDIKLPADELYTSLDTDIQTTAATALGVYNGAVVVTEISTGRILAMVSGPSFQPEEIADIWDNITSNGESSVLLNRVTQGLYQPGSTFKILTALEYCRQFPDTWQNYRYNCSGSISYGNSVIHCYHGTVHGSVDFYSSFAHSCNCSFANMALKMDSEKYEADLKELQEKLKLELELPMTGSRLVNSDFSNPDDVMQTSIGQGTVSVTPLFMNLITAAAAGGGEVYLPHMGEEIRTASGKVVKSFKQEKPIKLFEPEEAEILRKAMVQVVENGTGHRLKDGNYTSGGKTGSAEFSNNPADSHAWFTGFAPAEDPEIAVTIIIEGAGTGGDYAVPLAKRIMDAYFAKR